MSTAWTVSVDDKEKVIQAALQARECAYSPYSKFRVGAAFMTPDGTIVKGCNVENASYGGTICAERTAIVKSVSEGKKAFVSLAVTSDLKVPISPCGMCRQVIREFCSLDMPIYMVPGDYPQAPSKENEKFGAGGVQETTLGELLPHSFGPEHLDLPRP